MAGGRERGCNRKYPRMKGGRREKEVLWNVVKEKKREREERNRERKEKRMAGKNECWDEYREEGKERQVEYWGKKKKRKDKRRQDKAMRRNRVKKRRKRKIRGS